MDQTCQQKTGGSSACLGKIMGYVTRTGHGYGLARVRVQVGIFPPARNPYPRGGLHRCMGWCGFFSVTTDLRPPPLPNQAIQPSRPVPLCYSAYSSFLVQLLAVTHTHTPFKVSKPSWPCGPRLTVMLTSYTPLWAMARAAHLLHCLDLQVAVQTACADSRALHRCRPYGPCLFLNFLPTLASRALHRCGPYGPYLFLPTLASSVADSIHPTVDMQPCSPPHCAHAVRPIPGSSSLCSEYVSSLFNKSPLT